MDSTKKKGDFKQKERDSRLWGFSPSNNHPFLPANSEFPLLPGLISRVRPPGLQGDFVLHLA